MKRKETRYIPALLIFVRHTILYNMMLFSSNLKRLALSVSYLDLIRDTYPNTSCAVKVNGKRTDFFNYSESVRQGCLLSPLLFNIFINGVVKSLDKNKPTPLKLRRNISCLLYVDDLKSVSKVMSLFCRCSIFSVLDP